MGSCWSKLRFVVCLFINSSYSTPTSGGGRGGRGGVRVGKGRYHHMLCSREKVPRASRHILYNSLPVFRYFRKYVRREQQMVLTYLWFQRYVIKGALEDGNQVCIYFLIAFCFMKYNFWRDSQIVYSRNYSLCWVFQHFYNSVYRSHTKHLILSFVNQCFTMTPCTYSVYYFKKPLSSDDEQHSPLT